MLMFIGAEEIYFDRNVVSRKKKQKNNKKKKSILVEMCICLDFETKGIESIQYDT